MSNQMIFKRYEIKFMVPRARLKKIQMNMASHMIPDIHGQSTIYSLYFDTPDHLLVSRSLEHPVYKEKLRLRSYGKCTPASQVFLELKKKYDSVVYKRRVSMTEADAEKYLYFSIPFQGENYTDRQIFQEIDYARNLYQDLAPSILLTYHRMAFYDRENADFRVTFDQNILWRDYDLSLCKGIYGKELLPRDTVLMEVKSAGAIPLWFVDILSENHLYKQNFSKYGTAYQIRLREQAYQAKIKEHSCKTKMKELTKEGFYHYA